eukprot:gene15856-11349_t
MNRRTTSWQEVAVTPRKGGNDHAIMQRAETARLTPSPPPKKSSSFNRRTPTIGSDWTVTLARLKFAGSYFEAVECLREIRDMLSIIDRKDRLKFCKGDYDGAID